MIKKIFPFALLLLVAGCRGRSELPPGVGALPEPLPPPISVPPAEAKPAATDTAFSFSATADRQTLRRGDIMRIEMLLRNTAKTTQTVRFTSGQDFDLQGRRAGKQETAWTWSMDKMFAQQLREIEVRAGATLKFSATWDGTAGGTRLPRGNYELTALATSNPRLTAAPIKVTIQ